MSLSVRGKIEYFPGAAINETNDVLKGPRGLKATYLLGSNLTIFSLGLILPLPMLMAMRPIALLCSL
jgi:hypothetical protein